jgi:UDP-glucose 4-epimerase
MKVFMTGASGFIGSHVCKELLSDGHEIVALVRNLEKIPVLSKTEGITIVEGQLHDHDIIGKAMQSCEACVHVALGWGTQPLSMLENDTKNTIFLLQTAIKNNFSHFLYTSSTAALGELRLKMNETSQTRPVDYYGATKAACENFILAAGHTSFMSCNIIRPGYTYGNPAFEKGPTQPDQRFNDIVKAVKKNKDVELILNDGTQFIAATDIAKIYAKLLSTGYNKEIFLALGSEFMSWQLIAERAIELTGSQSKINLTDKGWGESPCHFDVSKLEREMQMKFDPTTHLDAHLHFLIDTV